MKVRKKREIQSRKKIGEGKKTKVGLPTSNGEYYRMIHVFSFAFEDQLVKIACINSNKKVSFSNYKIKVKRDVLA